MLADFCVRLAAGMTACLLLLSPAATARPGPGRVALATAGFFRTHCLTILAFSFGALLWLWGELSPALFAVLAVASAGAFLASVSWSLERSPGAVALLAVMAAALASGIGLREATGEEGTTATRLTGAVSSALLLGAALSAMLIGHSYLIAPAMSLVPLYRLLGALAIGLVLRAAVDGFALGLWWTGEGELSGDAVLWLPVRWLVGLAAPAVLCWMAWQTARIRSTQSATGILYVVVIFCFLGELTAQLLRKTGATY